ncbi:PilT protein domain protein [Candidatus Methylobacter favarea]|uniref:PilT protein domain protein n=1 Tax=Candidatus Methylobacter favarea TaxID=2707345 RepID=A0A8S0XFP7_9GAMM|nr:type II toxin-antitoxin system VapC family toxin [Candidatus Methylobacter favarea]CAA9890527.1 PilT protein domain protein [Candidatus Methylobacter favarea]
MTTVLDASALLCFLQSEPGANVVDAVLPEAVISSVNWAEVMQKSLAADVDVKGLRDDLAALGLTVLPFTAEEAEIAAQLWQSTRQYGLSLGDRACLALATRLDAPVQTADQVWSMLELPITVHIVRPPLRSCLEIHLFAHKVSIPE